MLFTGLVNLLDFIIFI